MNKNNENIKKYELAEFDYMAGLTYKEIAEKYSVSINTVKSWKTRYKWDKSKNSMHTKVCIQNNQKQQIIDTIKYDKNKSELELIVKNDDLSDKQKLFCLYYVKMFNATKAYMKAYNVKYESAAPLASNLLKNDKIKEEVQRLKQNRLNRELLSEEDIFQKYIDIAFADMTDFVEFGYNSKNYLIFKESSQVDGTLISEIKKGKDGAIVRLADRMKALDWLANHMDLATAKQKAEISKLTAEIKKIDIEGNDSNIKGFLDAINPSDNYIKELYSGEIDEEE